MNNSVYQNIKQIYQRPEIRAPIEIILSVFASLFLILTAIRPTLVTVAGLRKNIEDQVLVETRLDTKIKKIILANQQLGEYQDKLPLFERAVPEDYTYANLAKKIEILAIEDGVKIESLAFSSVAVSADDGGKDSDTDTGWVDGENKVKEFAINFSVVAEEVPLINFLKKIENLDRVLKISSIEIVKVREREILGEKLRAGGEINGYYLAATKKQK
jgi:hypothetical protein